MKNHIKLAVLGDPVGHSLSPRLHQHWLEKYEILGGYEKIETPKGTLKDTVFRLKQEGYLGWNVTAPHKETIFEFLDEAVQAAKTLKAVNTVKNQKGRLVGHNTDGEGFFKQLITNAPKWDKRKATLVLGAGGAARAVVLELLHQGCSLVYVANRTDARAEQLKQDFQSKNVQVLVWEDRNSVMAELGLVVNCTSPASATKENDLCDLSLLQSSAAVYDLTYTPLQTPLLRQAAAHGLTTIDGLGMLYYQAAAAFNVWFGIYPDEKDGFLEQMKRQAQ